MHVGAQFLCDLVLVAQRVLFHMYLILTALLFATMPS